jgi:myosin heavy subunit
LQDLLSSSVEPVVAGLFGPRGEASEESARRAGEASEGGRTVASKFLAQLQTLRAILAASDARFVRCIKSNDRAAAQEVNKPSVLRQLVCGGVMAALEVRRAGFPNKMAYADFVKEFRIILTPSTRFRTTAKGLVLLKALRIPPADNKVATGVSDEAFF